MEKFIPINKKSNKAQKEYHVKKRDTWGELNPMTRTMPNGKGYNRKKIKQEDRRNGSLSHVDMNGSFLFCIQDCCIILICEIR